MMRLKRYSRNSAKTGLLLLSFYFLSLLFLGCTSNTEPTYIKENAADSIREICEAEYKLEVRTKLVGETVWVYLPVEDFIQQSEKPQKYSEKFEVTFLENRFEGDSLQLQYYIKVIPETEKTQQAEYNKSVVEKIRNVWKVLYRVILSMDRNRPDIPKFYCVIIADIKNGVERRDTFYYQDLKKYLYQFISDDEYQHRAIQDFVQSEDILADTYGLHVKYKNISWEDFLPEQIKQRIRLKFQKPEVKQDADIDKEVLKVIVYTLKTYDYRDFKDVEITNLLTNNKVTLNQGAIWAGPTE
jgi:hypothetical protein